MEAKRWRHQMETNVISDNTFNFSKLQSLAKKKKKMSKKENFDNAKSGWTRDKDIFFKFSNVGVSEWIKVDMIAWLKKKKQKKKYNGFLLSLLFKHVPVLVIG